MHEKKIAARESGSGEVDPIRSGLCAAQNFPRRHAPTRGGGERSKLEEKALWHIASSQNRNEPDPSLCSPVRRWRRPKSCSRCGVIESGEARQGTATRACAGRLACKRRLIALGKAPGRRLNPHSSVRQHGRDSLRARRRARRPAAQAWRLHRAARHLAPAACPRAQRIHLHHAGQGHTSATRLMSYRRRVGLARAAAPT